MERERRARVMHGEDKACQSEREREIEHERKGDISRVCMFESENEEEGNVCSNETWGWTQDVHRRQLHPRRPALGGHVRRPRRLRRSRELQDRVCRRRRRDGAWSITPLPGARQGHSVSVSIEPPDASPRRQARGGRAEFGPKGGGHARLQMRPRHPQPTIRLRAHQRVINALSVPGAPTKGSHIDLCAPKAPRSL
jgi:hypothetical protein